MTYELTPYEQDMVDACDLVILEHPKRVTEFARGRETVWALTYEVVKKLGLRCQASHLPLIHIILLANIPYKVPPEDHAFPMEHIEEPLTAMLEAVHEHPQHVTAMREGKTALGFFVGQVMKKTKGRGHPAVVQDMLREFILGAVH